MATIKQVFISSDGKEFDTELEADARDQFLMMESQIEGYITAAGLKKAQAGLMRKHLSGFAAYLAGQETPDSPAAEGDGSPAAEA